MAKKVVELKMKNYNPNSQVIEIKKAPTSGYLLSDPATGKTNTELELFKNKISSLMKTKILKTKKNLLLLNLELLQNKEV